MSDYRATISTLEELHQQKLIGDQLYAFYRELTALQEACNADFGMGAHAPVPEQVQARLHQGVPLLADLPAPPDERQLIQYFDRLLVFLQAVGPDAAQRLAPIATAVQQVGFPALGLVIHLAANDSRYFSDLAEQMKIDPEMLLFCALHLARPVLKAYAASVAPLSPFEGWNRHVCPVCGGSAGMARLSREEEGRRYLYCSLCDTPWSFNRLTCCFCLNDDANSLAVIQVDDAPYRIDVCNSCKRYVKTRNDREKESAPAFDPFAEDLATMHLDLVAEREGFERCVFLPPLKSAEPETDQ